MRILFICKNNQFRSQMAAALYNILTNTNDASSAGTYVGAPDALENVPIEKFFQSADFFELMEHHGMYIRDMRTKKLLPEMLSKADIAVSMAEEPFVPEFLRTAKNVIWWTVENPPVATKEVSQKTFDQILPLIQNLIVSL
ncbi:hypothetical protein IPJ70_02780 [Candidatus Campbellbacteria bacterium]|nr:MAG: hypothetical protein IPJ70_02780 [Candidatus Campbellbacteria bacterium]